MDANVYGPILVTLVIGVVLYLVYRQGLMVSKSIRAVLFYFVPGKDGDRVRVDSCSGWVKHMVRLRKDRTYEFRLDARLSKGTVEVVLRDPKKQQLLKLDRDFPAKSIDLDRDGRYFLCWKFKDAAGSCELHW